jgi:hypothetical protein
MQSTWTTDRFLFSFIERGILMLKVYIRLDIVQWTVSCDWGWVKTLEGKNSQLKIVCFKAVDVVTVGSVEKQIHRCRRGILDVADIAIF